MNEKKYYVRLAEAFQPGGKYLVQLGFNGSDYYFDRYKGSAAENYNQNSFTKSELDEIMGGALYKKADSLPFEWLYSFESLKEKLGWEFNETIDKWEYTNLLIELVPVEDGE